MGVHFLHRTTILATSMSSSTEHDSLCKTGPRRAFGLPTSAGHRGLEEPFHFRERHQRLRCTAATFACARFCRYLQNRRRPSMLA